MHPVFNQLLARGPALTDGAWGTELQRRGLPAGDFPDAWNLLRPEEVEAVARSYVEAGSQIILTNTFGANSIRLRESPWRDQARAINARGVAISKKAAGAHARVFASVGPTGKWIVAGEISAEEVSAAFIEQCQALAQAGADGLALETMTDLEESALALDAAQATGLPVVVSFAFDSGKEKDRTMGGITPEKAARWAISAGADAVGANCGQGIDDFESLLKRLRQACSLPIWIKPNAGLPTLNAGRAEYPSDPAAFAARAIQLAVEGAAFLGGCCGTGPAFVQTLSVGLRRSFGKGAAPCADEIASLRS